MYCHDVRRRLGDIVDIRKMARIPLLMAILMCSSWVFSQNVDRSRAFEDLKRRCQYGNAILDISPLSEKPKDLAGHFTDSQELSEAGIVLFTGSELYLFPDQSYVYTEWGCELPETIYDKGTWSYTKGLILLKSDGTIPGAKYLVDRTYVPIIYKTESAPQLRLVGIEESLSKCGIPRINKHWDEKEALDLKNRLMKDALRPDFWAVDDTQPKGSPQTAPTEWFDRFRWP